MILKSVLWLVRMFLRKIIDGIQDQLFYLFAFSIFFIFIFLTVWGENGILRLVELKRIKENVVSDNGALLRQNLAFVQEIEKLKDSRFVEQRARTDLGMVRASETVFIVKEK